MIHMSLRQIMPAIGKYIGKLVKDINNIASLDTSISTSYQKNTLTKLSANLSRIDEYTTLLKDKYEETCKISDMEKQAFYIKDNLLPLMAKLRGFVDECEIMMPKETWPMPTYEELLFSEH